MDFKDVLGKGFDEKKMLVMECIKMLEKYLSCFPQDKGKVIFSVEDMKLWREKFFPQLVQNKEVVDLQFLGSCDQSERVGINGIFAGYGYFLILYQLYKKLYELGTIK